MQQRTPQTCKRDNYPKASCCLDLFLPELKAVAEKEMTDILRREQAPHEDPMMLRIAALVYKRVHRVILYIDTA